MPIYESKLVNLISGKKMEKFNTFIEKMNQKQKIAFGSIFSIAIFIIAYGFARTIHYHPFSRIDQTWIAWLPAIAIIGFIWYKLLEEKI